MHYNAIKCNEIYKINEYASNNRVNSVAMQRRCKHAFPTIERLCFLRGPCKEVIKKSSVEAVQGSESSFETPVYQLGNRGIELSRFFGIGSCRIMVRN
jgi:hypothetical protein